MMNPTFFNGFSFISSYYFCWFLCYWLCGWEILLTSQFTKMWMCYPLWIEQKLIEMDSKQNPLWLLHFHIYILFPLFQFSVFIIHLSISFFYSILLSYRAFLFSLHLLIPSFLFPLQLLLSTFLTSAFSFFLLLSLNFLFLNS